MRWSKVGTGAAVVLSAVALSGCVVFQSRPTAAQTGIIGPVRITVTVCASQSSGTPPGSCTNQGNSSQNAATEPSQLFLGFRVPKGTTAPTSFKAAGGALQFNFSPAYTSELQRLDPRRNQQWVGYTSGYFSYSSTSGRQSFTAKVVFGLPHPHGAPFARRFKYQVVVGGRQHSGHPHAKAPINCGSSLTTPSSGTNYSLICVDDPPSTTLDDTYKLIVRDATITGGNPVAVTPGQTGLAHFTLRYAGQSIPAARFTFRAATTIPGATASPSTNQLTPKTNSTNPVSVTISVPAGTHPGHYLAKLSGKLPDGESRSATVAVTVPH